LSENDIFEALEAAVRGLKTVSIWVIKLNKIRQKNPANS
jgi:hypothetical protein